MSRRVSEYEQEQKLRARYLRNNIKLVSQLPQIYRMLSAKNDVPTVELVLTDLKVYRHEREKNVVLIATAFYLYLVKVKFSSVLSTVGASATALFNNATLKPYCRWALNAVHCEKDFEDPNVIVLTPADYPTKDDGDENMDIDLEDGDEILQMHQAYCHWDPESGIEGDAEEAYADADAGADDDDGHEEGGNKKRDKKGKKRAGGDEDSGDDIESAAGEVKFYSKTCPPWKHVSIRCESEEDADTAVMEIENLKATSIVLRSKWSRKRQRLTSASSANDKMRANIKNDNNNNVTYEYLNRFQAQEEDEAEEQESSDDDDDEKNNKNSPSQNEDTAKPEKNLSKEEARKRKREANRRRNKLAAEKNKNDGSQSYLDFSKADSVSSGVITADALRLANEMRKVSALMSADGSSDAKLLKEVMMSRLAAARQQKPAPGQPPVPPPPDPLQLLRQHLQDNERTMEQVFALHYEKFLTFVDKTSQMSTKTVERVHRSHDAIGNSVRSCATSLKDSASLVVESRLVLSRVSHVTQVLKQRIKVSRLLETAERCVTNQSAMGVAEILSPLHDAAVNGGLPATDTLASYVVAIRLPQLRQTAASFATNKLHSWLASLRDSIIALGEDLWRKSVDYRQINRMSERVEHVRKRLLTVEPLKIGKPHSWKIDHSVVAVSVDDISALFASAEGTARLVSQKQQQQQQQSSALDQLLLSKKQKDAEQAESAAKAIDAAKPGRSSLSARLAQMKDGTRPPLPLPVPSSSTTTAAPTTAVIKSKDAASVASTTSLANFLRDNPLAQELHQQQSHLSTYTSKPGEFRGASYGRTLRRLFKLCGSERDLLTTCIDTRRLHLSTLLQSFETSTDFSAKAFVNDCTRALGFLHCEELLVHEADIDFTMTHLLYVWSEIQQGIAQRSRKIGRNNPPACALLFRTLTQFKTAALGCLLIKLPESEVIDRARQEHRDAMESGMVATITTTLQQLAQMDMLEPIQMNSVPEAIKKNILQFNLHLCGTSMLPIANASNNNSLTNNANTISSRFDPSPAPLAPGSSAVTSRFQGFRNRHGSTDHTNNAPSAVTTAKHQDPTSHPPLSTTTTTATSRLSINNQQQAQSLLITPTAATATPYSSIVPAVGDLLLGFLNESFSLGYDLGIDGGNIGANSDEAHAHQGNRVIDGSTGVMTEILDGSIHREWIDNTSLQMVQAVLRHVCSEYKMKLKMELVPNKDLKPMAILRNNIAATRIILSTLEQRYSLLFHGSLPGTFEFGKAVFMTSAGDDFLTLQVDAEQQFSMAFLNLISERLAPLAHLSTWEKLFKDCVNETKGDAEAFTKKTTSTTRWAKLMPCAKQSFMHLTFTHDIVDVIKFLFKGIWPEAMACAQARMAVNRVADCIRDYFSAMLEKCEIRKAQDLLDVLPLISSVIQDAVETMMNSLNRSEEMQWTIDAAPGGISQSRSRAASPSTAVATPSPGIGLAARLLAQQQAQQLAAAAAATAAEVITFPMENLDAYFTKMEQIVQSRAEEYQDVANKIGANLDFAQAKALKFGNIAARGVGFLGNFAASNVTKLAGHVAQGAKDGYQFVEVVAGTVTSEVKNTYRDLKQEADEAGDIDFKNVTNVFEKDKKDKKSKKGNGDDDGTSPTSTTTTTKK